MIARQERPDTVLAVLEAGDQEAKRLARDGSVNAVLDRPLRGGFGGSAEGWLTLLRSISQPTPRGHTPCFPRRGWRGALPPVTPNCKRRVVSDGKWPVYGLPMTPKGSPVTDTP